MTYDAALETLAKCRYCLMCRHADPLSHVTFNEALTPHGLALTIHSEQRGLIAWHEATLPGVFSEVDAGVARAHCVTDQPFSEAVAAVRTRLVSEGVMPEQVAGLKEKLELQPSLFGNDELEIGTTKGERALFIGDEAHYLWPSTIEASFKLLEMIAKPSFALARGHSNGFIAASLGFIDTAKKQAKGIMKEVSSSGARELIVLSPGDAYTLTELYQERLNLSWPESIKVIKLSQVLAENIKNGILKLKQAKDDRAYAYIDPTHTLRVKDFDSARNLLKAILPGEQRELFWRRERAHPVGSTALQFVQPEMAEKLTRARLEDAQKQGVEFIVSEDPGTLAQLARYAQAYGLEVKGLYELLAAQLG